MIRTALITGANRGIGFEIAKALAGRSEIRVLAAARILADARAAVEAFGSNANAVELDLSRPADVAAAVEEIDREHGPIDILVNNAAVMPEGGIPDAAVADFEHAIAVNTSAPYALIHVLGPRMRERGWGRIVNLSSGWGAFAEGLGGPVAYSVSKAALNAVTVSAAAELGPAVKVNSVCPGWVRTRMGGPNARRSPEEAADTPVWLATLPDDGPTGGFFRRREAIDW